MKKELITNHIKLSRWAVQSHLAKVDSIKIGFVSRNNINDNKDHTLYGFYEMLPHQLLTYTNFNEKVGWGIIKTIYDKLSEYDDGKFLIAKVISGTKFLVKLFRIKSS